MIKKFLASTITFIIFITSFCNMPVFAATISYVDADGVTQSIDNATQITSELTTWTGWVYATGDVTIATRVEVSGEANLILCDDCELNCAKGIEASEGNSFTIYAQTNQSGKLIADARGWHTLDAGIGGNGYRYGGECGEKRNSGTIIINGGEIYAYADKGAAIGGGSYDDDDTHPVGSATNVIINAGKIFTTIIKDSYNNGSDIGSGDGGRYTLTVDNNNNITIKGGEICSTQSIGSNLGDPYNSKPGNGDNITITGGKVYIANKNYGHIGGNCEGFINNFSTELDGQKGNAFIEVGYIIDESKKNDWSGIIHLTRDKEWIVGGEQFYDQEINIANDEMMTIYASATLNQSANLNNEGDFKNFGTFEIENGCTFENSGTFENASNAKMIINGTLNSTGEVNWNSTDISGSGEIIPEEAKISASIDLDNLDKEYDGKPVNFANTYSANGKDGAGKLKIIHKKGNEILKEAPSEIGEYSVTISAESGKFYKSVPAITKNYVISESTNGSANKIDFNYNEKYYENVLNQPNKNEIQSKTIFTIYNKKESVEILDGETKEVEYEDGTAIITIKKFNDDLEIEIKDENGNELNINEKIILVISLEKHKSGIVAAQINSDDTRKIIRKSIVRDGKIYIPLNSSAKLEIIDNGKTFYDVPTSHWAYDAVTFVSAHELFNGTVSNVFEPETPMSRAMMVQVLHNLEDNPKQAFEKIFSDVNIRDWFAEAVTWGATHRGTIIGYDDGRFGPNDNITREQLATILYRYFGKNEIVDANLNFADANEISDYALKAMKWAVKYGIIQGKGNNILDPKGLATRAEVSQMFQNLMLNLFYR